MKIGNQLPGNVFSSGICNYWWGVGFSCVLVVEKKSIKVLDLHEELWLVIVHLLVPVSGGCNLRKSGGSRAGGSGSSPCGVFLSSPKSSSFVTPGTALDVIVFPATEDEEVSSSSSILQISS